MLIKLARTGLSPVLLLSPRTKRVAQGFLLGTLALAGWVAMHSHAQIAVRNQGYVPFSEPPINYRSETLSDPVAQLQHEIEAGKHSLKYEPGHGYLKSVLHLLNVPVDSQTLVFSKTSFQYKKISPEHPRALYFNDDVYVGSVHEGKAIEIISFDPRQGAIFYLLDERKVEHPGFQRAELDCTQCHIAAGTRGVPGVLLRSIYPTATGTQATGTKSFINDQETPFEQRWGGWYVTGRLGGRAHLGNSIIDGKDLPEAADVTEFKRVVALSKPLDTSAYLSPDSDVVAHLVLAHQTQMHNLITLTNYKTRLALYAQANSGETAEAAGEISLNESSRQQYERPAEQLLRYMLFANEAPFPPAAKIQGSSSFMIKFAAHGPRDPKGRSLRDFDLRTRTFRYPCSYLIYSKSFDALPDPAREYIYHRLLQVLTGEDQNPDFARISTGDRHAILEILLATKQRLPEEWRTYANANRLHIAATPSSPVPRG